MLHHNVSRLRHLVNVFGFLALAAIFGYMGTHPLKTARYFDSSIGQAAVGLYMSVEENPYNYAAEQLKKKELALEQREKAVSKAETDLILGSRANGLILIALGTAVAILFLLVGLNYYFDYKRKKSNSNKQ